MIKDLIPLMPDTIDEIIKIIGPRATKHIHTVGGRVSIRVDFPDAPNPSFMDFYYLDWVFEIEEAGACFFTKPVTNNSRNSICVKPAIHAREATA